MPKTKVHSGLSKRVKVTGSGRLKHKRTGLRHNLDKQKTRKQKRHLNVDSLVSMREDPRLRGMLKLPNVKQVATQHPAPTV